MKEKIKDMLFKALEKELESADPKPYYIESLVETLCGLEEPKRLELYPLNSADEIKKLILDEINKGFKITTSESQLKPI